MRGILLAVTLATLSLVGADAASAQAAGNAAPEGEPVSFTAQVIDLSCKFVQNQSGPDHKMCAQVCADKGQPLGLLTDDGQVYLPVNDGMGAEGENARLRPFAEEKVDVTGKVLRQSGVNAIIIDQITQA